MVKTISIGQIDFSGWLSYTDVIRNIMARIPAEKKIWLRSVTKRYLLEISSQVLSQNINVTGTYLSSMTILETGSSADPQIALAMRPQGTNADRLPFYWTVLEFGAKPNPNVPFKPFISWASTKFGGSSFHAQGVRKVVRERGIRPHPILQTIFKLSSPSGTPIGLTPLAEAIANEEAELVMRRLQQIMVTPITKGPRAGGVVFQDPATGRFTSPNG